VAEALSSGNVIATAKRHAIQAQQIYRWRERLEEQPRRVVGRGSRAYWTRRGPPLWTFSFSPRMPRRRATSV
jgi:transposase-like protein